MNLSEIKKLIKLFESSGITELEVEQEGVRVLMKKGGTADPAPASPLQASVSVPAAAEPPSNAQKAEPERKTGNHIMMSPMVGTFYRAPAPTSPSYVEEGDLVNPGQTLCIIEAMKLMNEIECEVSGKIVNIFPENGKPVEYGEPLFEIELK